MTEKKNNPFLNFTIFAVAVHAVTWGLAILCEWLMNRVNIDSSVILTQLAAMIFVLIPTLPIILFFILKERFFEYANRLPNSLFQLVIWVVLVGAIDWNVIYNRLKDIEIPIFPTYDAPPAQMTFAPVSGVMFALLLIIRFIVDLLVTVFDSKE